MPTTSFEITDHDIAVEPWGPINRRLVVRGPSDQTAGREEATLLFAESRSETGVAYHVGDDTRGTTIWGYLELGDFHDVLHLVEAASAAYLHYGYISGSETTRTLYFLSVQTFDSIEDENRDGPSLPRGPHDHESLDLPGARPLDEESGQRNEEG
jgi:hypothetical protein